MMPEPEHTIAVVLWHLCILLPFAFIFGCSYFYHKKDYRDGLLGDDKEER